jgi:hypothetical protein
VARRDNAKLPHPGAAGPTLEHAFKAWVVAQGDDLARVPATDTGTTEGPPVPLVLVAAHGGGIRAAYWAALALDCVVGANPLEPSESPTYTERCTDPRREPDERRQAARRIFLMSGVSGGAVGLYAYARQLLRTGDLGGGWVDKLLGGDFASDTVAWSLFHDLPNHLIGFNSRMGGTCRFHVNGQCFTADRAAVLEETFDRQEPDGADAATEDPYLRQAWDMRLSANDDEADRAALVPLIVDNSTVTGGKTRAVTSAVQLSQWPDEEVTNTPSKTAGDLHPLAGTAEVRAALCTDHDMRLSTAAVLAARFPFLSPSGRLNGACKPENGQDETPDATPGKSKTCRDVAASDCEMELVDGGYTDNSGLFTIDAVMPTIHKLVTKFNARQGKGRKIAVVIVELDNHYRASITRPPSATGGSNQSLVPLLTALGGRSALETYARAKAYRLVPQYCAVTISPGLHPGLAAPLGWELSPGAIDDLRTGLVRRRLNLDNEKIQPVNLLRRLQTWLSPDPTGDVQKLADCVPAP